MDKKKKYGIGKFSPDCLQCCASMKIFAIFYSLSALMTSTLSVYVSSQITTLEKQFGFTSTQSGFLMSCNDIGYLSLTLFISYFADRAHIPRTLSMCTVVFGLSGIICSIPYFISPKYTDSHLKLTSNLSIDSSSLMSTGQMCEPSSLIYNSTLNTRCTSKSTEQSSVGMATNFTPVAMAIIAIGMIIQGFGKSPRQAYTTIYIEKNVDRTKTAVYVGSIMAVAIFGPALGFGLGGLFSQIYVTLEDVNISPRDPRWIGAWWLGYLAFGLGSIIAAIPVMCFPKRFKEKEICKNDTGTSRKEKIVGDFFRSIFDICKNKLFVLIVLGRCLILIIVSGGIAFGPKYIETQYNLPAWKSNLLIGVTRVASVSVGTFVGGYLTSKKKLSPVACAKAIVILSVVSIIYYALAMIFGCETPNIIRFDRKKINSSDSCSQSCNCDAEEYFPVCGSDNQNYFSPCHAGCTTKSLQGFANCSCISGDGTSSPGLCASNCSMLIPYMVLSCVFGLIESTAIMPGFIFMIRSVKEKEKGIAIAFSAFVTTLLGWFLGPVIFGEIIDMCCKIWNARCGSKGSCALYDNVNFRFAIYGFSLGMRFVVFLFDLVAFLIARKKTDWSVDETEQNLEEKETFVTETEQTTKHALKIYKDKNILPKTSIKETEHLT